MIKRHQKEEIMKEKLKKLVRYIRFKLSTVLYNLYVYEHKKNFKNNEVKIISDIETVDKIINNKVSLARFGDGELSLILNSKYNIGFQKANETLSQKLSEVLCDKNNKHLMIGIPSLINPSNYSKYRKNVAIYYADYYHKNYKKISSLIDLSRIYSDSMITRCYMDYLDKSLTKDKYDNLKRIWEKKDIVIIEGDKTKIGVGNDLLSNARSIKRIICPSKNAFSVYDQILSTAKELCKNKLTLIALGPTATVLAYDLSLLNDSEVIYQAIDIGHIDIEYEWFIKDCKEKVAIKGKYVNEVIDEDLSAIDINNDIYLSQIIKTIN